MNNNMCSCGNKRSGLNNTNWSKHITSGKKKKFAQVIIQLQIFLKFQLLLHQH